MYVGYMIRSGRHQQHQQWSCRKTRTILSERNNICVYLQSVTYICPAIRQKACVEVFGPRWINHQQRIREDRASRYVQKIDAVPIAGDTSWAMHLKEAQEDLMNWKLPGTEIYHPRQSRLLVGKCCKLNCLDEGKDVTVIEMVAAVTLDEGRIAVCGTHGCGLPGDIHYHEEKDRTQPYRRGASASNGACRKR